MTVLGQPVNLRGTLNLGPGGRGTKVDLDGELKVAIPLLGKKLEQSSAPAVLAGFRTQQRVGDRWLASSSGDAPLRPCADSRARSAAPRSP